jgi:hypothetical protein
MSVNARFGVSRGKALAVIALAAIAASTVSGSVSALADGNTPSQDRCLLSQTEIQCANTKRSDHWGVITRNTIGSPVAALRNGPFGSFGVQGPSARPPYGTGSLGIEVADKSTSLNPPSEKVDFGNEVDFFGDPVLGLTEVGFHVFQTGENVGYGGTGNLPNIRFEINPNPASTTDHYSTLVWVPGGGTVAPANPPLNRWSPYIDATSTGTWYLTGMGRTCNQGAQCTFAQMKATLPSPNATIYSVAVGKGRDYMWIGAVDGLRINRNIYDFEADGVRVQR